eukprot:3641664-Pyramimonas_sp.AAC.2
MPEVVASPQVWIPAQTFLKTPDFKPKGGCALTIPRVDFEGDLSAENPKWLESLPIYTRSAQFSAAADDSTTGERNPLSQTP